MSINFNYNYPQVAREAGFKLRQYNDGPLDWRLMGSLEVERLLREQSLEQIDGVLRHLSEAPLGNILETNILDSGIAKYFIISQFSIQYLLFCRQFLDETVHELRDAHAASEMELAKVRRSLTEANKEILQLHKKLTQMEAIHEVVYPCHLCTKNFVSNDALNIHIARKHPAKSAPVANRGGEKRSDGTPNNRHGRDNDINLINTIKLELEIKQLKERLNVAEREIKERSAVSSKRSTPSKRDEQKQQPAMVTKTVGIQSNLIESKEKDTSEVDEMELRERKQQLTKLQDKIHAFEEWKETQRVINDESIAEIHRKLAEISQALESAKASSQEKDVSVPSRQISPSVEDLERILTEKVAEIGKASAVKLEEVVYHMEMNYKEKLIELEREIKNRNLEKQSRPAQRRYHTTASDPANQTDTDSISTDQDNVELPKKSSAKSRTRITTVNAIEHSSIEKDNGDVKLVKDQKLIKDETAIEMKAATITPIDMDSVGSESNRTFVKAVDTQAPTGDIAEPPKLDDSTDISESLNDETLGHEDAAEQPVETKPENEPSSTTDATTTSENPTLPEQVPIAKGIPDRSKEKPVRKKLENDNAKGKLKVAPKVPPKPPRIFTHKDATKLANNRLIGVGLDMKSKTISTATAKRISSELADKRSKLRQKYPHFHATRNKIKKFVDKLCSSKLPESAEALLKTVEPLQPLQSVKSLANRRPSVSSADDSFDVPNSKASTPLPSHLHDHEAFKERLERILASPMHQPGDYDTTVPVQLHAEPKPLPVPRKRVMFNTQNETHRSDDGVNGNDNDSPIVGELQQHKEFR